MAIDLVQTLSDLVSLPSVNPMGKPVSGPEYFEYRVTEYLEKLFESWGLPWTRQTVEPKRDNIVCLLEGSVSVSEGGPLLMFEAHQDTVPVEGMIIEPWSPEVRDGKIYGRGSCDIKGGMCAMLGAVARLAVERPAGMPNILMACTVNEEFGYSGAQALSKLWEGEDSFVPRRPDAAIVAEPTSLDVVIAHKGALRWRCRTKGRASHSSQPHLGVNAIYRMSYVLQALEAYQRDFIPTLPQHALCGPASLSVGLISGGISVNTVPDECVIEIDRRMLPGEVFEDVYEQITSFVRNYPGVDFPLDLQHDPPFITGGALSETHNQKLADAVVAAAQGVTGACEKIGVPYGTDAAAISAMGVPTIVFGPGSIAQAHTCDEWLEVEQLKTASEIIYQFGSSFHGPF